MPKIVRIVSWPVASVAKWQRLLLPIAIELTQIITLPSQIVVDGEALLGRLFRLATMSPVRRQLFVPSRATRSTRQMPFCGLTIKISIASP